MLEQYKKYNKKDYLQVVTLVEYEGCPPELCKFLESCELISLSSLLSVSYSEKETTLIEERPPDNIELTEHEVELIRKLERRWKRRLKISDERRRAQETIEGRLIEDLFKMMDEKWTEPAPSLRGVIRICRIQARKRIFSALPLMVDLENAHIDFQRIKAQAKLRLDRESSVHDLDELYAIHAMLPPIERQFSILDGLLTVNGLSLYLQTLHSSSFDSDFRDFERMLITTIEGLNTIRGRVEAIR
ncbi:TPR and ankyrin repeat-containing protein 1 [Penicillium angulare]|uniref:TPR and ankyrin repeat-containing protein 1 n=1 Tax=Penicillium angulare TaxID=116970 RepID=UPI00253F6DA7|nr:TPR and ankyrin repeat-containing protein 1 [Penicillium angulare]KAJ5280088.1 TPR and ankyrin repeat-containing protein 1 [Penicillium angulare]